MALLLLLFVVAPPSAALVPPLSQKLGRCRGGASRIARPAGGLDAAAASWMTSLRTPAALVAGSSLSLLLSSPGDDDDPSKDTVAVRLAKRVMGLVLLTSFLLEVMTIFCSTVTSTKLLAEASPAAAAQASSSSSALEYVHDEFEFEYVTIRFCFLQGLLHWMAGVGLRVSLATTPLAAFYGRAVLAATLSMICFYNRHLTFYGNYGQLALRFLTLAAKRAWPPRVTSSLALASILWAAAAFLRAARNEELDLQRRK